MVQQVLKRLLQLKQKKFSTGTTDHPFFLSESAGIPLIFYFQDRKGGTLGTESFPIMIARAEKDKMKDMMFLGGFLDDFYFRNQGFTAWKRIE